MRLILIACGIITFWMMSSCDAIVVIRNEDDLIGTCTKTCEEIPELFDEGKCIRISGCRQSSEGWTRGFVRCDYCACNCEEDLDGLDIETDSKSVSVKEKDLYGTCKHTCDHKSGLVRTNFRNCQEVRNCRTATTGKNCDLWWRNDYCTCTCINRKYANSYELTNIEYNQNGAEIYDGEPSALEFVDLRNEDPVNSRESSAAIQITNTQTKTIETSKSLQLGLTMTVSAGIDIEIFSIGTSLEYSATAGYTYTTGSSESVTHRFTITPIITVPPASKTTAVISASVFKINVPYTATLVTTYEDGSTSEKQIEGIYTDVETARFTVTYNEPVPLN